MIKKAVPILFGVKGIVFFILLESLTVPLVAISNSFVIQSIWYMAAMGFIVAFICVFFLVKVLKKLIIRHFLKLFGVELNSIKNLWYLGLISGILLMIMFFIQNILFSHGWHDATTGFISAFVSVGATLLIYQLMVFIFNFGITVSYADNEYVINFTLKDIFILSVFFGLYELIVCPITGLWIPYPEHRFSLGLISGIIGGGTGGILVYSLTHYLPLKAHFILEQIEYTNLKNSKF